MKQKIKNPTSNQANLNELLDMIKIVTAKFSNDFRSQYHFFLPINRNLVYARHNLESDGYLIDISTGEKMQFVDLNVDDLISGFFFDRVYKSETVNIGVVWKDKKYINIDLNGRSLSQQTSVFGIQASSQYGKWALHCDENYIYWALPIYNNLLHLENIQYNLNLTKARCISDFMFVD